MQIFFLDPDPEKAARYQCDKHVIKMILESAQLLSTTHHETNSKYAPLLYKATHRNHPCAIWTRSSNDNYRWLFNHFIALCSEYNQRYNKTHKTYSSYSELLSNVPDLPRIGFTKPALAMPDEYKCCDPVESYRRYYRFKRTQFNMVWPEEPCWINENIPRP